MSEKLQEIGETLAKVSHSGSTFITPVICCNL